MRSTGEVMASAGDFRRRSRRRSGRRAGALPTAGTAFLTVRDADKAALVPVAAALAGLGFKLVATERHGADARRAAGLAVKVEGRRRGEAGRRPRSPRAVDLVVNTPPAGRGARTDGYRIREAALVARVPCITTISGAAAAVHAIANARTEPTLSLQERIDVETRALSVSRAESVGPYTLLRVERGGLDPGTRDSSSCSNRRGGCCRGRCRSASRRGASWRS